MSGCCTPSTRAGERAVVGIRKREWTAIAATEADVVAEMARWSAEISAGRVPK
jgi:hypothetical protein